MRKEVTIFNHSTLVRMSEDFVSSKVNSVRKVLKYDQSKNGTSLIDVPLPS